MQMKFCLLWRRKNNLFKQMRKNLVLGLDIGGSGVKGAVVDVVKGEFVGDRIRIPTPSPHTPSNIISAICEIVDGFKWKGPIGCGFPGVITSQIIETAANLGGRNFVGVNLAEEIGRACGCEAWIINDADAAGCAEINFGIGKDRNEGVLIMLTVGTGIGVSMFSNRTLVPNLEFGHLRMRDKNIKKYVSAEKICSDAARKSHDLSWQQWASRFNKYLEYLYSLCWPDLIIIGGGVASKSEKFLKYIKVDCDIAIAKLENRAGIIGAAYEARKHF